MTMSAPSIRSLPIPTATHPVPRAAVTPIVMSSPSIVQPSSMSPPAASAVASKSSFSAAVTKRALVAKSAKRRTKSALMVVLFESVSGCVSQKGVAKTLVKIIEMADLGLDQLLLKG
jgi:hypothetical protein